MHAVRTASKKHDRFRGVDRDDSLHDRAQHFWLELWKAGLVADHRQSNRKSCQMPMEHMRT